MYITRSVYCDTDSVHVRKRVQPPRFSPSSRAPHYNAKIVRPQGARENGTPKVSCYIQKLEMHAVHNSDPLPNSWVGQTIAIILASVINLGQHGLIAHA